ncbi:hypothetical protein FX541_21940 [Salmonella enterica]|nr:hypothetical protein [Salmonella enterica]ECC9460480.1 hypothetical protein [Salmonella enterica subsp. salamae]ECG1463251.1 hypothetical protein [Salmonella enterica subsp. salamae]ECO4668198.1 hypothetical protein [Salmonella enterica]EFP2749070.1 hypothetical protein [Salmonella enterica]
MPEDADHLQVVPPPGEKNLNTQFQPQEQLRLDLNQIKRNKEETAKREKTAPGNIPANKSVICDGADNRRKRKGPEPPGRSGKKKKKRD